VPHSGTRRLALEVSGVATHLASQRFFGTGSAAPRIDETTFALNRRQVGGRATFTAANWLSVTGTAGMMTTSAGDGRSRRVPAISTRFTIAQAPGLTVESTFNVASLAATVDYRDIPPNPRSGGRYHVAVSRYADARPAGHSFTRFDAELEQHLSAWKRQRVLTLRAVASSSIADAGNDVPFYLQPTLGGSRVLRGFVTDRFRDRNLLALQAEYGWDVLPFLNAVVFYEAGTVAPRWTDINLDDFRRDYGLGFRFGSARTVAFRTDVALGSGEGARITMRLNHAF
jgi:outer membrane protein assembly factor BamA